jgi:hypothetical protein
MAMKRQLVDTRRRGWWWAENDLIDAGWMAKMGPHTWAVYCVLLREADGDGYSFPSLSTISEKSGVSPAQVKRALHVLRDIPLVERSRKGTPTTTSVYRLLNVPGGPSNLRERPTIPDEGRKSAAKLTEAGIIAAFDEAWDLYPKRPNNSRMAALKAFMARVKEGVSPDDMIAGVKAYAKYCQAEKTEPRFVKMTSTFFGPNHHFASDFSTSESGQDSDAAKKLEDFYRDEEVI